MVAELAVIRKTPGVSIYEIPAFPPSVVGVQTAVPAFIGYTEMAVDPRSGRPVYNQPIPINSMADFQRYFGAGFRPIYNLAVATGSKYDFLDIGDGGPSSGQTAYTLTPAPNSTFHLFNAIRLFYANGGGPCYVISVANYDGTQVNPAPSAAPSRGSQVTYNVLSAGLSAAANQVGPTMLVVPEATLLGQTDYNTLCHDMLAQCASLQDRVAILDVYGAANEANWDGNYAVNTLVPAFQQGIASAEEFFSYGMAYYPFLQTGIVQASEVDFTNLNLTDAGQQALIEHILSNEATRLYGAQPTALTAVSGNVNQLIASAPSGAQAMITPAQVTKLNQFLTNALPSMQQIENLIAQKMDLAPPSGIMAGVFSQNDQIRGVWNAPANVALNAVVAPTVALNDSQHGELNVPLSGTAVNVVRYFPGRGPVVWGARTLDGNSNDYRYIQVRRTLIYIEQSVKAALQQFVFAPNDGKTWSAVTAMISNFLQQLWSQGGLMGDKASDAFSVQCGLNSTMTGMDVLQGYMIVSIGLQMVHPAEFVELRVTQTMQGVS